jgi:hypothetical protein
LHRLRRTGTWHLQHACCMGTQQNQDHQSDRNQRRRQPTAIAPLSVDVCADALSIVCVFVGTVPSFTWVFVSILASAQIDGFCVCRPTCSSRVLSRRSRFQSRCGRTMSCVAIPLGMPFSLCIFFFLYLSLCLAASVSVSVSLSFGLTYLSLCLCQPLILYSFSSCFPLGVCRFLLTLSLSLSLFTFLGIYRSSSLWLSLYSLVGQPLGLSGQPLGLSGQQGR